MLKNNLDITYAIVWLLALANVVGTLVCIASSGYIARLTTIRFALLAPFLFMIIAFAAFQSGQNLMDLVALFAIGLLGILLKRFDWSRPAFLIGFVLSNPAETYANQAVQIASSRFRKGFSEGLDYIFSPIVIGLIIITILSVALGLRQAKNLQSEGDVPTGSKRAPMVFLLGVLAYLLTAFGNAWLIPDYSSADKVFPLFVGGVAIVGASILLIQMMFVTESHSLFSDGELSTEAQDQHGLWSTLAWFAGLLALTSLIGFILALSIFLFTFLLFRAGQTIRFSALYTLAGIAFMCAMAALLNRDFPPGLLQGVVDLPWPLT